MKKECIKRTMHSLVMSSLASVGSSESPTGPVSSKRVLIDGWERITTMTFIWISGSWSI